MKFVYCNFEKKFAVGLNFGARQTNSDPFAPQQPTFPPSHITLAAGDH
jgi:hypothetical protein